MCVTKVFKILKMHHNKRNNSVEKDSQLEANGKPYLMKIWPELVKIQSASGADAMEAIGSFQAKDILCSDAS